MITKEFLINELVNNTFVILKASAVAGVGVFAIRDIPRGTRNIFSAPDPDEKWKTISKHELSGLPQYVQDLITNYCLFDDEHYFLPEEGFKKMDLSHYLNHSDVPNVVSIDEGAYFEAIVDIRAGEELFVDYGTLVQDEG